jgi:RNA polymerase sigma factor (sigma-70 family)
VPDGNTFIGRSRRTDSRSSTTTKPGRAPLSRAARRDWKLVQQAVAGDSRAREELFTIHTARLYRTAFSVLHNKEDAQDAVQNSLCSAFLNLGSFKGQSLFSTWLTRIVINSALMIRRGRTDLVESSLVDMMDSQPEQLRHRIVHTAPNPEEAYAVNQTNELVSSKFANFHQPFALRFNFAP